MLFRRLGRTDLQVSELSYGAARGAAKHPERFEAVVRAAIDAGINFIDTAAGYEGGKSEEALGKVLKGQNNVLIETKYCPYEGYWPGARYTGAPQQLVESVETSLRRLQRDHVDVLLGHGIRSLETLERFMADGCYEAMLRLKQQGKARFIGISELSEADGTHEVLQRAIPTNAFDVVMVTMNMLLQTAAHTVLPLCHEFDVGTVVMMPLNQPSSDCGLTSVSAALEAVRRLVSQSDLPAAAPYTSPDVFDFLTPHAIPDAALRYVLAHAISTCCVGTLSVDRMKQNLSAIDPPYLDDFRLRRIRDLFGGVSRQIR